MSMKRKAPPTKKKAFKKKPKVDPLDRWGLEPKFKMNLKRSDQNVSAYFVTNTAASSTLLSTIAQGVGDNMRVGQRVRMFNLTIRGLVSFFPAATGTVQGDTLRAIIYYDRQTNKASATWADLIFNINSGTSLAIDPPNWYNRGRFKILRDFSIQTPPLSATVAGGLITGQPNGTGIQCTVPSPTSSEMSMHFFKALKGKLDIEFSGTGATAANITGGGIFLAIQNFQGTGWWNIDITTSIEFMDV